MKILNAQIDELLFLLRSYIGGADETLDEDELVLARRIEEVRANIGQDTNSIKFLASSHHDNLVVMQAAYIEWKHGKGAEAAMGWIENTLDGPGLIPDEDEPYAKQAQFYFDANQSNPFPTCSCGNPSHIGWMGQGFCCQAHYQEAKAKHESTKGGSNGEH